MMHTILKNSLVFLLGLFVCFIGITTIQYLRNIFFPLPEGLDLTQSADRVRFLELVSLPIFFMVELSYIVGSFLGGATIGYLASSAPYMLAGILGGFFTLTNILNIVFIPHPVWMSVLTMVTFVPVSLAGCYVARTYLVP